MDEILQKYWQPLIALIGLTGWLVRLEAKLRAEKAARIAADSRIDQSVRTAHEMNKEQGDRTAKALEGLATKQTEMVDSLHKVELTLTEIAAYEKGRTDERAKRGHDD